jgi:hypothetical protein
MGPRAGLDNVEKRKFLTLPAVFSDPLVVQPEATRYTGAWYIPDLAFIGIEAE